jgi:hypothetical protein
MLVVGGCQFSGYGCEVVGYEVGGEAVDERHGMGERERRELYVLYTPFWREKLREVPDSLSSHGQSATV